MNRIEFPSYDDKESILELYRQAIGTEGCTWDDNYPDKKILEDDYERHDIFVMKTEENLVIGAVSIDKDDLVSNLSCWSNELEPSGEIARVVVRYGYHNQGIACQLIEFVKNKLKARGYKGVNFLVSNKNEKAKAAYKKLNFNFVGQSNLFGEDWLCYEKEI